MPLELGSYIANCSQPLTVTATGPRVGLFPMPLALINRQGASPHRLPTLAVRLFHALMFLSWNLLQSGDTLFVSSAKSLRDLVGRPRQTSNADVENAFELLRSTLFEIPNRDEPRRPTTTAILQGHGFEYLAGNRICWWRFDDTVAAWCRGTGMAYGWLDVRHAGQLSSVAALRLYELASALVARTRNRSVEAPIPLYRTFFELMGKYDQDWPLEHRLLKPAIDAVANITGLCVAHDKIPIANLRTPTTWKLTVTRGAETIKLGPISARPLSRDDVALLSMCAMPGDRGVRENAPSVDVWEW